MLIFGIIDFGRALYAYHFVANAARDGARYAIVRGGSSSDCPSMPGCPAINNTQNYIQGLATGIGLTNDPNDSNNPSGVLITTYVTQVAPSPSSGLTCTSETVINPGCVAQVTVIYPFSFISPFLPKSSTCTANVNGSTVQASICMTSESQMVVSQ
jgi:Flp pilus assembly protein TadG